MTYPDWKAYETGALSAIERAEADELLTRSEAARMDYAAYQEYKAVLRQAALSDMPTMGRLEAMLRVAAPRNPFRFRWTRLAVAAAALFALAFAAKSILDQMRVDSAVSAIENMATLQTSDPREAARWMNASLDFRVPALKPPGPAKLVGASYGKGWGAYEYDCAGQKVKLVVRPRATYEFSKCGEKMIGKTKFYVGTTVGWKCPSCCYEMVGGEESLRFKLATAAAQDMFGGL